MHRRVSLLLFLAPLLASLPSAQCVAQVSPPGVGASSSTPAALAQKQEPVSSEVSAAEAAIAKTDWKSAEATLDPWLAAHPNDARALFDAGYVADVQNRSADAASLYSRAVKADPNDFDAHLLFGILLAREGKLADARTQLASATQLDPGEGGPELKARAWRALARIDSNTDPTTASNDLLQALKLTPETPDDMLLAADLAAKTGDDAAAESEYRRVLAKNPNSAAASAGLAHLLIKGKQYPEAETLLRNALQHDPDNPTLTAQLAAVLAAQDKAEALPLLQKLHADDPNDRAVTLMLAEILADAGDFAASDDLYVKLLAVAPQDPDLLVGHGQNLVRQMKYAEAYDAFDKATQLNPGDADGWSGLAFAASRTDRPAVTVHALTMRAKLLPDNASTYFLWALAYDSLHQKAEATAYYHHFLEAAGDKFPTEEWQARQRLKLLEK